MNDKEYYAVKSMFVAESIETAERIEWCNEYNINFFNTAIMGTVIGGKPYTSDEMKEIGIMEFSENGITKAEIDLSTLPPKNIGMGFVFHTEQDAVAFKLRWM
jgi:hypothetical protein